MIGLEVVGVATALVVTIGLGLVAHEWTHALVLWLGDVEYDVSYFPARSGGVIGALASYPWAVVEPVAADADRTWVLRLAAVSPLALSSPVFVLAASGVAPADDPIVAGIAIGVLACALPSPQDFSVAFYAHRHGSSRSRDAVRRRSRD
ncbi:hypothetical protein EL22_01720 [Halostagnicola sp. A56]|uniref:hypothetical protein n=1 Tax=Halostagnicola sp. A56 TaxID=1495067 RepID=UPI00049F2953|nr:hypothetical protein [Halostagnicola sp. A56]KDE58862.1 hypothetical protein EL22_01720 [Halostagnicola sp. A56]